MPQKQIWSLNWLFYISCNSGCQERNLYFISLLVVPLAFTTLLNYYKYFSLPGLGRVLELFSKCILTVLKPGRLWGCTTLKSDL